MHFQDILYVLALGLPAVLGQTSTKCSPLDGCHHPDSALGTTISYDFTTDQNFPDQFTPFYSVDSQKFTSDGMVFPISKKGDSPGIRSKFYIFFGKVDIVMKAATGHGIISDMIFLSDCLDEIDLEFVGSHNDEFQSNLFSKGVQDVKSPWGASTPISTPSDTFHKYTVDWQNDKVIWSVDDVALRTITRDQAGSSFPQTPMQINVAAWSAGDPGTPEGTMAWADGPTDYSKGPFDMIVKSISVTDYATGATQYDYGDNTCSDSSIQVSKDPKNKGVSSSASSSATTSTSPSSSSTSSTSSTTESESSTKTTTSAASTSAGKTATTSSGIVSTSSGIVSTKVSTTFSTTTSVAKATSATTSASPAANTTGAGSGASSVSVGGSLLVAFIAAFFAI